MLRVNVTLPGTDPAAWANGPVDGAPQNSLVDADGDTYFFSPNPAQAAQSLDCNDGNASIHPGAAETLDQVDQDCDYQVDEGLTLEPYAAAALLHRRHRRHRPDGDRRPGRRGPAGAPGRRNHLHRRRHLRLQPGQPARRAGQRPQPGRAGAGDGR